MLPSSWLWPWSSRAKPESQSQPQSQSQVEVQSEQSPSSLNQLQSTAPAPTSISTPPELQPEFRQPQVQHPQTNSLLPQNVKLFLGGALFVPLTLLLTRRAMRRRYLSTIPPYYTSTTHYRPRVSGAVDGFEAFSLASLNVMSFAMLATGVAACALDVNSIEDLRGIVRRYTREQVAVKGSGEGETRPRTDEEIENELQEWAARVMSNDFQEKTKKVVERLRRERGEDVDGDEK